MSDEQCLDYVKPFYYPDEAAAAWCGINEKFFKSDKEDGFSKIQTEHPCFQKRLEHLLHAINTEQIGFGRDGVPVSDRDHVAPARRTVTPMALKHWIETYFPNERPAFLFNHLERKELKDRDKLYEQVLELQNKNDYLEARISKAVETFKEMKSDGKETIQQKRERAFSFWLAGKGYQFHEQESSKFHVNDLNRKQVWKALHGIDSSLFNANMDDFFKKQQLARFLD